MLLARVCPLPCISEPMPASMAPPVTLNPATFMWLIESVSSVIQPGYVLRKREAGIAQPHHCIWQARNSGDHPCDKISAGGAAR